MNATGGAFKRWQEIQRELHRLEVSMLHADPQREVKQRRELMVRAGQLKDEVDKLFPLAMEELEGNVRRLKDKRPQLHAKGDVAQ